jgi:hypothetical protein
MKMNNEMHIFLELARDSSLLNQQNVAEGEKETYM